MVFHGNADRLQVEFSTTSNIGIRVQRRNDATSQYSHIHSEATNVPDGLGKYKGRPGGGEELVSWYVGALVGCQY